MRRAWPIVAAVVLAAALAGGCGPAAPPQAAAPGPVATAPTGVPGPVAKGNPGFTANVIAPLKITDVAGWQADLKAVKAYGVNAVSVDVWWGDVEKAADNSFDWSYYDRVFADITAAGLKIAPILSFHQCGGNVGDDYTSLLPPWLFGKYANATVGGITLGPDGLKVKSEQGNVSAEYVQGWADQVVENEYIDFTRAFVAQYGTRYASDVVEVNVSLGPSGELRYPAYNSHDTGSGYPTRGALQAYSPLAVADLQQFALRTHGSLDGVNTAWGTTYSSPDQIGPPADAGAFFATGAYRTSRYGKDVVDWYNGALVDHGKRVLQTVGAALGGAFPQADLGYKFPGVHWAILNPTYPRAAEVTTGLIQTSVDVDARATGHGYRRIVDLAKQVQVGRRVVVHFTALEMGDDPGPPAYSQAKTLVGWIGQYAFDAGVPLKGENALQGGVQGDFGWDQIEDAFSTWGYLGLTVLRIQDVAEGPGATRYAQLIKELRT